MHKLVQLVTTCLTNGGVKKSVEYRIDRCRRVVDDVDNPSELSAQTLTVVVDEHSKNVEKPTQNTHDHQGSYVTRCSCVARHGYHLKIQTKINK